MKKIIKTLYVAALTIVFLIVIEMVAGAFHDWQDGAVIGDIIDFKKFGSDLIASEWLIKDFFLSGIVALIYALSLQQK